MAYFRGLPVYYLRNNMNNFCVFWVGDGYRKSFTPACRRAGTGRGFRVMPVALRGLVTATKSGTLFFFAFFV